MHTVRLRQARSWERLSSHSIDCVRRDLDRASGSVGAKCSGLSGFPRGQRPPLRQMGELRFHEAVG